MSSKVIHETRNILVKGLMTCILSLRSGMKRGKEKAIGKAVSD